MGAELVFTPEACDDLAEAVAWYDRRRAGLGEEFLSSVNACIQSTMRMPSMHEKVHNDYRRALVRRFPYAVFYECDERFMTIYGVFHTARDPDLWRRRLA